MRRTVLLVLSGALVGIIVTASAAGAQDGSVVIETQITFSATEPPSGTFEVLDGADILGCSSGSFVDPEFVEIGDGLAEITKVLSCESGPKAGTISILFIPGQGVSEPDRQTGPWEVEEGTGDFVGLTGGGDFSVEFDSETTGVETLSGSIAFPEAEAELAQTGSESARIAILGFSAILIGLILVRSSRRLTPR